MTARVLEYCLFDTSFGFCGLAWSEAGLVRVQLPERDGASTEQRLRKGGALRFECEVPARVAHATVQLRAYFDGVRVDFADVALDVSSLVEFDGRIFAALRTVGYGATTTYGGLAAQAIGGFSAYGGAVTKAKLLRMEGVDLDRGQLLLPGL
jgi:methylated-DNA-[protein]-cysteine S-methyltransferase